MLGGTITASACHSHKTLVRNAVELTRSVLSPQGHGSRYTRLEKHFKNIRS